MNCPKCGKSTEDTSKFCEFCGASLNEFSSKACTTVDVSSEDRKNAGTIVKGMWIISIFAIIFIFITHFVGMVPISSKAKNISEERKEHITYESRHNFYGHNYENCSECSDYKEAEENNNKNGAMLWQNTITYCSLIAFAGAMVYGIGAIAEKGIGSNKEQI